MYLDASACREKYKFHSFIYRYIYPNNCSPLCLHDYMTELSKTPFQLLGIWDDRWSYYLTAKQWALNFERHRDKHKLIIPITWLVVGPVIPKL